MNKLELDNRIRYSFNFEGIDIGVVFYNKEKKSLSTIDNVDIAFGALTDLNDTRFPLMGIENIPINVSSFEALLVEVFNALVSFRTDYPEVDVNFTVVKTLKTEILESKAQMYINGLGSLSSRLLDKGNYNYIIQKG